MFTEAQIVGVKNLLVEVAKLYHHFNGDGELLAASPLMKSVYPKVWETCNKNTGMMTNTIQFNNKYSVLFKFDAVAVVDDSGDTITQEAVRNGWTVFWINQLVPTHLIQGQNVITLTPEEEKLVRTTTCNKCNGTGKYAAPGKELLCLACRGTGFAVRRVGFVPARMVVVTKGGQPCIISGTSEEALEKFTAGFRKWQVREMGRLVQETIPATGVEQLADEIATVEAQLVATKRGRRITKKAEAAAAAEAEAEEAADRLLFLGLGVKRGRRTTRK
jgi:hypothetical protein